MTEQRIPQRGLPKPPPKRPMANIMVTYTNQKITGPDSLGRYRYWESKEDRYCRQQPVGPVVLCVVDNFGFLVPVRTLEVRPWF